MSGGSFRVRKNGLIELRFRYNNESISVYGRTKQECIEREIKKIWELSGNRPLWEVGNRTVLSVVLFLQEHREKTVYVYCLRYCENARQKNRARETGYVSLVKVARFIGRSCIGNEPVRCLNEKMIERFIASASDYSEYVVRRAVCLLKKIMKGKK